jgi:DNA-binding FadR family transcriptional regulator
MSFHKIKRRPTLAEEVSAQIKESILGGEYPAGQALPTEPELSEQFGVSRAVIRDAVRMLSAQGLIDVQHGRGMFVTASLIDWFAESLYTTLRREGANVWDVEQFEEIFYPRICTLAAEHITEEQGAELREAAEEYIHLLEEINRLYADRKEIPSEGAELEERLWSADRRFYDLIFSASGNKLLRILGMSTLALRNFRYVSGSEEHSRHLLELEKEHMRRLADRIAEGDSQGAASLAYRAHYHSRDMVDIMEQTPIGEKPTIPYETIIAALEEAGGQP